MAFVLATNWWALALRGIVAILFAALTFFIPGITITFLVLLFGGYALVDGILAITSAVRAVHGRRRWGAFLLEGVVGIAFGLFTFVVPSLTLLFLIYLVGAWAIVTGVLEIAAAVRLRRHIAGEWLLGLMGLVSILFGVAIYAAPVAGAVVIALWIGAYALVFGVLLLTLAFRLRAHRERLTTQALSA
jgi:uncharacterized membrane protein HdeD (DUF308 family)